MTNDTASPSPRDSFMRTLRLDHARLSRVLREIDVQQAMLPSSPKTARAVLVDAMHYLLHYQDGFHHPREDRLFERIEARAPHFQRDTQALMREHQHGHRYNTTLANDLVSSSLAELSGARGRKLSRQLRDHVSHTRAHMRSEEVVFYARAEEMLEPADWAELTRHPSPEDPLSQPEQLQRKYPRLAKRMALGVTEVTGQGDAPGSRAGAGARGVRSVAREGVEQVIELYGELAMDAFSLVRANLETMLQIRSPLDLVRAGRQIGVRNGQLAARSVIAPSRLAVDIVTGVVRGAVSRGPGDADR